MYALSPNSVLRFFADRVVPLIELPAHKATYNVTEEIFSSLELHILVIAYRLLLLVARSKESVSRERWRGNKKEEHERSRSLRF